MSSSSSLQKTVKSIIKIRKLLLKNGKSYKNDLLCHKHIKTLNMYIGAYGSKWNEEGWRKFVINHISEITYLIPDNPSGLTLKKKLYENL